MPRWLKILVAAALMIALAFMVDWRELRSHAAAMNWAIAALAFAAIMLEMPVNAAKWSWSLRLHGLRYPWMQLFRVGCMGYFFNNFLPSAIGGDVYRVYRTWATDGDKSAAVSAVLIERLVGVGILLVNGCIGALFLLDHSLARAVVYVGVGAVCAAVLSLPLLIHLQRSGALSRRFAKLIAVEALLGRLLTPRIEWLWLAISSLAFQVLAVAALFLCFAAVDAEIDVPKALLITAAAGLASVLPISISGLGVVEGSIAGVAVALGGPYEAAVLAALLLRLLALAVSALCGLFCFFDDGARLHPIGREAKPQASATMVESRTSA